MKAIRIILLSLFTIVVWSVVNQYFFCPFYTFRAPAPFEGKLLYNPYAGIDSGAWYKCNFHAHCNAWMGMTNGDDNATMIWNKYDSLGYSIHCVSQYEKINEDFRDRKNYIPAYEHGYNCRKTHQLVLGNDHVLWLDYFFPQTLSNKQHILNVLKQNDSDVIVINHPELKKSYSCKELRYLTNYQCMEVLNTSVASFSQWDAALSAGKAVFIVGDDDTHHINDLNSIGRECTWVNVRAVNRHNVLMALRTGHSYGMHIATIPGESRTDRIKRLKYDLPYLKEFTLRNDTLSVSMSTPAKRILFIGQDGKELAVMTDTTQGSYVIKKEDRYVRAAALFEDGTGIFLNPVFRHSGDPLHAKQGAFINHNKTILFFLLGLNILLLWMVFVIAILLNWKWPGRGAKASAEDMQEEEELVTVY